MDGAAAGGKNFFHDHHAATAKVAVNRRRSITPKIDAEPSSDGASSSAWSIFHQPGSNQIYKTKLLKDAKTMIKN
jgi:hypothetical protein